MTGIPEGFLLAILAAIGVVAWWGIRRIVSGQDAISEKLETISERLGHINGRVGKSETWQVQHEKFDDERHDHLQKQTDALWAVVRGQ